MSELQPRLSGRVGKRLYAAMILVAAAVKHYALYARGLCALGDNLAHDLRRRDISPAFNLLLDVRVERARCGHRMALDVIDHLHADMLDRTKHAKPRTPLRTRQRLAHPPMNALAVRIARKLPCWHNSHRSSPPVLSRGLRRAGLSYLFLEPLADDANALLFVRIRRAQRANIRRHLADQSLVRAAHGHARLLLHRDLNPLRDRKLNRMRITQREYDVLALHFRAIADADDIQFPLEPLGDTLDRICNKGACKPVQSPLRLAFARRNQVTVLLLELDPARHRNMHLPFGALHVNRTVAQLHFHP